MLHGFIFHLICLCFLTWQNIFSLDVSINHNHRSFFICHVPDKHWHFFQSCQFTGPPSTMPCDHFISSRIQWTDDSRHQDAILLDTLYRFLHFFIVHHTKRMVPKHMKLTDWESDNFFSFPIFHRILKNILIPGKRNDCFSFIHLLLPPASRTGTAGHFRFSVHTPKRLNQNWALL